MSLRVWQEVQEMPRVDRVAGRTGMSEFTDRIEDLARRVANAKEYL
jgi:hypothetical protein